jgi:hypothetical protein
MPATSPARTGKPAGQAGPEGREAGQELGAFDGDAQAPESPVTEGVRSLEVRWIFPGQIETALAEWFGRFPAETQSREDTYLVDPQLRGLSVKVRGGSALELKMYCGSPGIFDLAGRARGRMEFWRKWSWPMSPLHLHIGDMAVWRPVRKRRRISRFALASGPIAAHAPGREPWCGVELTEIRAHGQDWWTLGFEATGPAHLLSSELQAAAALIFAQPMPGSVTPGPDESRSYREWLYQLGATTRSSPAPGEVSRRSR